MGMMRVRGCSFEGKGAGRWVGFWGCPASCDAYVCPFSQSFAIPSTFLLLGCHFRMEVTDLGRFGGVLRCCECGMREMHAIVSWVNTPNCGDLLHCVVMAQEGDWVEVQSNSVGVGSYLSGA